MAKYRFLCFQSILHDLQTQTSQESAVPSLTALNEIITSSQEEREILNKSDWVFAVMSLLESDTLASDICLKILINSSKKHEEVRRKLLEKNIFYLLADKLRKETDFWKNNLILYSALMVVLIQGNIQAQNQMRISGCLSLMVYILSYILDEAGNKPLPYKNAEIIIYTIVASNKNPYHPLNRTEIGWVIPKILEYFERQANFSESEQFQLAKCFWFFIKSTIEKNESNQQIFLKSSGVSVLFRSIQDVLERENCNERKDLLYQLTGILLKVRRDKEFLYQAAHFCPVMILCSLLKTCDCLVVQQTVIFLEYLSREYPHTLQIMKTKEVQKQIKKAKIIVTNKTVAEICQSLWNRLEIFDEIQTSQEGSSIPEQPKFLLSENNFMSQETNPKFEFNNHFCIIHDVDVLENSQAYSENLFNTFGSANETKKNTYQIRNSLSGKDLNFYENLRKKERRLKKVMMSNYSYSKQGMRTGFNIGRVLRKKITFIIQKFFYLFGGVLTGVFRGDTKRLVH